MNNYVVLNGNESTNIRGLLIQSLPPITKPLIRTSIEQIDGRDGDIVKKLGYSAYDKQFSIGLYGEYDVDEVIEFFDSEGKVIFSNEPDKLYNYQILNQINFERLIRYWTATVTMHCQPFKYSAVEKAVRFDSVNGAEGVSISNNGNISSKPKVTIYGSGTVNLSINGTQAFAIDMGEDESITIDSAEMEAYSGGNLKNRQVSGDYDDLLFKVGKNKLTWTGDVSSIEIANYSRWI